MKIAVSNIAWNPDEREQAYQLLQDYGVTGLEIAPGMFLHGARDVFEPDAAIVNAALEHVTRAGLELVSMQSLLFGVRDAALFGNNLEREQFMRAMQRAIALAGRLQIPNVVFGSPRQRTIPSAMDVDSAYSDAISLFRQLGDDAAAVECVIAVEPNPSIYGTNFLNTVSAADAFVRSVKHSAITLNLDIGAMIQNQELDVIERVASDAIGRISHVHISEPMLMPAPVSVQSTARVMAALSAHNYVGWFSIEMQRHASVPMASLQQSLERVQQAVSLAGIREK